MPGSCLQVRPRLNMSQIIRIASLYPSPFRLLDVAIVDLESELVQPSTVQPSPHRPRLGRTLKIQNLGRDLTRRTLFVDLENPFPRPRPALGYICAISRSAKAAPKSRYFARCNSGSSKRAGRYRNTCTTRCPSPPFPLDPQTKLSLRPSQIQNSHTLNHALPI